MCRNASMMDFSIWHHNLTTLLGSGTNCIGSQLALCYHVPPEEHPRWGALAVFAHSERGIIWGDEIFFHDLDSITQFTCNIKNNHIIITWNCSIALTGQKRP